MKGKIQYAFAANIWKYEGPAGWYFVSLPLKVSKEIRTNLKSEEEGWGRLKATAQVGNCTWETAIWFDTKQNTYLLPLKAAIRKAEALEAGMLVSITVWI